MVSILAIVSKAIFEVEAKSQTGQQLAVGGLYKTSKYCGTSAALKKLATGGNLYLVTVRPGDTLWLVAVLKDPKLVVDGWESAAENVFPIADVTTLIPRFKFSNGNGIQAVSGKLGMSLQTPRVLTDDDTALLDGLCPFVITGQAKATQHAWIPFDGTTIYANGDTGLREQDTFFLTNIHIKVEDISPGNPTTLVSKCIIGEIPKSLEDSYPELKSSEIWERRWDIPLDVMIDFLRQSLKSGTISWRSFRFNLDERGEGRAGTPPRILAFLKLPPTQFSSMVRKQTSLDADMKSVVPACKNCDRMLINKGARLETTLKRCPHCKEPLQWYPRRAKVHVAELPSDVDVWMEENYNLPVAFHGQVVDLLYPYNTTPFDPNNEVGSGDLFRFLQESLPGSQYGPVTLSLTGSLQQFISYPATPNVRHIYPQRPITPIALDNLDFTIYPLKIPQKYRYDASKPVAERIDDAANDSIVKKYQVTITDDRADAVEKARSSMNDRAQIVEASAAIDIDTQKKENRRSFKIIALYLAFEKLESSKVDKFLIRGRDGAGNPVFKNASLVIYNQGALIQRLFEGIVKANPGMELFAMEQSQGLKFLVDSPGKKIVVKKGLKVRGCRFCGVMYLNYVIEWVFSVDDFSEKECPYCHVKSDVVERQCKIARFRFDQSLDKNVYKKDSCIVSILYNDIQAMLEITMTSFYHLLENVQQRFYQGAIGPFDATILTYVPSLPSDIALLKFSSIKIEPLEIRPMTLFPEDLIAF